MKADWYLMEERRRQEGLSLRCKLTRNRRRKAFLAGARKPSPSPNGQSGGRTQRGGKGEDEDDWPSFRPLRSPSSMSLTTTVLLGLAVATVSVTCIWGGGALEELGLSTSSLLQLKDSFILSPEMATAIGRRDTH